MSLPAPSSRTIRASSALALALALAACGGGGGVSVPDGVTVGGNGGTGGTGSNGGTGGNGGGTVTPPAPTCTDVTGAIASNVRFSDTDKGADTIVSSTGITACFSAATASAVRSTTAIQPGSFHYFEAKRSGAVTVGLATTTMPLVASSSGVAEIVATAEAVQVRDGGAESNRVAVPNPPTIFNVPLTEGTVGFAVDYRGSFPIVYVLGSTAQAASLSTVPTQCAAPQPINAATPCVLGRHLMPYVSGTPLYIYASGSTLAGAATVSINGGTDLAARPFQYAPLALRQALRLRWIQAERGFNAQWPQPSATALPIIAKAATYLDRAVVRIADTLPYTPAFAVTAAAAGGGALTGGAIQWLSASGALLATGTMLSLVDTGPGGAQALLGAGTHRIQAVVTDPVTGQVNGADFVVTFTATDSDDDGDGVPYQLEKSLGTDPSNPDTDGDGLSDGVEQGYGRNPMVADNPVAGTRVELTRQTGLGSGYDTSIGIVLDEDKLRIALTGQLNPDCVTNRLPGSFSAVPVTLEQCNKRAIRANVGIAQGEFRYYETRRLIGNLALVGGGTVGPNMGQGFVTATGKIDPYCCIAEPPVDTVRDTRTPLSFSLNNAASMWDTLVSQSYLGAGSQFNELNTFTIGFAVDYRGAEPVVYAITTDGSGNPAISAAKTIAGFSGAAVPFVYGHPQSDTDLAMEINFGLKAFHYNTTAVRALIDTRTPGAGAAMVAGVGHHRRP